MMCRTTKCGAAGQFGHIDALEVHYKGQAIKLLIPDRNVRVIDSDGS